MSGDTISNICKRYGTSRKTYYKWNNRYKQKGIEGLSDTSRRPCNINYKRITSEVEETKRFVMKHPNDMVQMDIIGPFYLNNSSQRNYIISCLDDCSRIVGSRWSERKRSVDVLNVLEDWIMINGKPDRVMHDNGKQFTSTIFRRFLVHNHIKDKRIPNCYPQLQGKIEAYNKIVKNEFLAVEDIPNIDDGKLRYDMFVKAYNETREHGGINGLTPSEMFLLRLITATIHTRTKQQSLTHVGNQKCNLSM
jgi:transposase InsO family protein